MSNAINAQRCDYGLSLYLIPCVIFLVLLNLRNSDSFAYLFEWLPVLGRTLPHFCLSLMLVCVFKYRGGSLPQLGMRWPAIDQSKFAMMRWMILSAVVILAMRIFVAVAVGPLLDFLPETNSRSTPLNGDLSLLATLLPIMWLVVIGEEVMFRGLVMRCLAKLFGDTTKAWILAIFISAVFFGVCHIGKGLGAMIGSGLGGLAYGLGFFLFRKNLWPVILAHCSGNTIGFVGAYFED